jgi:ubiquinone/menaquinone biosynthesis C-methylase UbiE
MKKNVSNELALIARNRYAHDQTADKYDQKHAEIYNPLEQARLEQVLVEIIDDLGVPQPDILDLGAGTGNISIKLIQRNCCVTALDVSLASLEVLKEKIGHDHRLVTVLLDSQRLPFPDSTFDVVTAYSVLHHIPDYLGAIREMIRLLRPGGLIYIDHEANPSAWGSDANLAAYKKLCKLGIGQHISMLVNTGEFFTFDFWKCAFIKLFVNPRFEREGDIHVWPDDHIEWSEVCAILFESGVTVEKQVDYLCYQPRGGKEAYDHYHSLCSDTRMIIGRKKT